MSNCVWLSMEGLCASELRTKPCFSLQHHDATRLHYDLRLEVNDGRMASWALPEGLSTDPYKERWAIMVRTHPVYWGDFEGPIIKGRGMGEVIVSDQGIFANRTMRYGRVVPLQQALTEGEAVFQLSGKKVLEQYRIRHKYGDKWLIRKLRDDYADPKDDIFIRQPQSVITGLTLEDVKRYSLKHFGRYFGKTPL